MQKYKIIINYFDISKNIVDKGKIRLIVPFTNYAVPFCKGLFPGLRYNCGTRTQIHRSA